MSVGSAGERPLAARRPERRGLGQWLTGPVRALMRQVAAGCLVLCLALIGADWAGVGAGPAAVPAALVLGLWANLLSLVLLASRPRG